MKSLYLYKIKDILKEVWIDFKNPKLYGASHSSCCGFEPDFDTSLSQPTPEGIIKTNHNLSHKNFKK